MMAMYTRALARLADLKRSLPLSNMMAVGTWYFARTFKTACRTRAWRVGAVRHASMHLSLTLTLTNHYVA